MIKDAQVGIELCSGYSYELLKPEMTRMKEEFEGMKLKAEARMNNTCAMDLREDKTTTAEPEEDKILVHKRGLSSASVISTFIVTSGVVYLGLLGF